MPRWPLIDGGRAALLGLSLVGMVLLMEIAPRQNDRAAMWTLFIATVLADVQPFVILWRLIRGRRRKDRRVP